MRRSFHLIAYQALEVCNAVEMAVLEAAIARTGLKSGSTALDLGAGNAAVAIRLAERFDLALEAVEVDPDMAALARARAAAAGSPVKVTSASSAEVLARRSPVDLIVALGTTDVTGRGRLAPRDTFEALKSHLAPGGWLLWGDLTWVREPPGPLRQMAEAVALYADDAGWRAAAEAAGFEVAWSALSPQAVWDAYVEDITGAVARWLRARPEAPEAMPIKATLDRLMAFFMFGRPFMGFGLYLLRA